MWVTQSLLKIACISTIAYGPVGHYNLWQGRQTECGVCSVQCVCVTQSLLAPPPPPQSTDEENALSFTDIVDEDERTTEGRVQRVFVGWFVDSLAFRLAPC